MPGMQWDSFTQEQPEWCAEFLSADRLVPGGSQADISQFGFSDQQTINVESALTAGDDVELIISEKLTSSIPKGQIFDFGTGKTFQLTEDANIGATRIKGDLAADLDGSESFEYTGISGRTVIPEGVLVGRTYAERDAGDNYGPADLANDDEIFLVAYNNTNGEKDNGITLVRHRHHIYENKLPDWDGLDAAAKATVRSLYDCLTLPTNV